MSATLQDAYDHVVQYDGLDTTDDKYTPEELLLISVATCLGSALRADPPSPVEEEAS